MSKKPAKLTPMMEQYWKFKEQHTDKLLLFRMGDFFETFFDDAKLTSKILGITLTARNKKDDDPIALAGFPHHALDNYLDKLVRSGLKVAICEQVEDPKQAVGVVKRDIVRIITPGAILDQQLLGSNANNYLGAVYRSKSRIGLAMLDISTGDFLFTELKLEQLTNELQRLAPSEILVVNEADKLMLEDLKLESSPPVTITDSWQYDPNELKKSIKSHFHTNTLESLGAQKKTVGIVAAGITLAYAKDMQRDELKHITEIHYYSISNYMQLDEVTRRNLELLRSMRYGDKHGSLISILDETKTPMGSRLLQNWLMHPLLSVEEIDQRLNAVQNFIQKITFTSDLRQLLDSIGDLSRLLSKLGAGRINPREINALAVFLEQSTQIRVLLESYDAPTITMLRDSILEYEPIIKSIRETIVSNPPVLITEGNIINDGIHQELDELRSISRDGKSWIARLEDEEKQKTSIPSLKVGYNKVFGYYLEVTKTHKDKVPDYYIRKQTLVNSERYISPRLKEFEAKVLSAEEKSKALEHELYLDLRNGLAEQIELMQQFVQIVATLDVMSNFAFIAYSNRYSRPSFNDEGLLELEDSRHPVIEKLLEDEQYIPNDVNLDSEDNLIAILTGPNMAGKSTYLRQIGLIAIMAQIGCYVPAEKANLPIFDRVFTRVGASDNLAMGQSTFLVEMIETANILNSATSASLILLDEIGRGTSTFDGLSLAWAIVEYVLKFKEAKTLFATHYHELTEMEQVYNRVKNYNIAVREWNDKMIFIRKIERGGADQSYGIQVARLAGLPSKVINRAKQILKNLESQELSPQGLTQKLKKQLHQSSEQIDIFEYMAEINENNDGVLEEIKELDLNIISPIEAWKILKDIQEKIER